MLWMAIMARAACNLTMLSDLAITLPLWGDVQSTIQGLPKEAPREVSEAGKYWTGKAS